MIRTSNYILVEKEDNIRDFLEGDGKYGEYTLFGGDIKTEVVEKVEKIIKPFILYFPESHSSYFREFWTLENDFNEALSEIKKEIKEDIKEMEEGLSNLKSQDDRLKNM